MSTKLPRLPRRKIAAIAAVATREYWEKKHRELVRVDNTLCETYGFSRSGYRDGKQIKLTVDKMG